MGHRNIYQEFISISGDNRSPGLYLQHTIRLCISIRNRNDRATIDLASFANIVWEKRSSIIFRQHSLLSTFTFRPKANSETSLDILL